jgi:hypothetical protein
MMASSGLGLGIGLGLAAGATVVSTEGWARGVSEAKV